jgi:ribonuclease Y
MVISIGLLIVGIGAGLAVGVYAGSRLLSSRRADTAAAENLRLSEEAKRSAEAIRREAQVEAREEALKLRAEVERELQGKRG